MNLHREVDNREVFRCDHCKLIQFATATGQCRKCHKPYNAPEPEPVEQVGSAEPVLDSLGEGLPAAHSALPHLPRTIVALRQSKGLSQRDLAALMGCPRTYVSKVENGKAIPVLETLERFAKALNVSMVDIINGTRETETDPFMLEIIDALPHLNRRDRGYLVDMVRQLATTEAKTA